MQMSMCVLVCEHRCTSVKVSVCASMYICTGVKVTVSLGVHGGMVVWICGWV